MKLNIDKTDLLKGLGITQKAVGTNGLSPILSCVLVRAQEGGALLTSTNLELAIRTGIIPADVSEFGAVALEARMFSDMVKRLPDGEVEITVGSDFTAYIKCKKTTFKLNGNNFEEFPAFPEVSKDSGILINSEALGAMIRQTVFAVSDNPDRPNLNGQLLKIEGGNIDIAAVDGFRIAYRRSDIDSAEFFASAIVPGKCMVEISKLTASYYGDISMYFTSKHILFEFDSCTVVSRLIDGEFIKYRDILEVNGALPVKANRREMLACLERAMLVSNDGNQKHPVMFAIETDAITVTSLAAKSAIHEDLSVETDIEGLSIAFNPKYLVEALKAIDDDEVFVCFSGELSPFIVKPVNEGNYKHLILPLNLKRHERRSVKE